MPMFEVRMSVPRECYIRRYVVADDWTEAEDKFQDWLNECSPEEFERSVEVTREESGDIDVEEVDEKDVDAEVGVIL